MAPTYNFFDVPKAGIDLARVCVPRVQPSVPPEVGRELSAQVSAGEWTPDGEGGALNSKGQNVTEWFEEWLSTRPHCLIPGAAVDNADACWTSGNLTAQGKRWRELRAFLGSDAATNAAMAAEAAQYGTAVGSTKPGVKPGTKSADDSGKADSASSNPWSPAWLKGRSPDDALREQTRLIRTLGTKAATAMARSVGMSVFGTPLR